MTVNEEVEDHKTSFDRDYIRIKGFGQYPSFCFSKFYFLQISIK